MAVSRCRDSKARNVPFHATHVPLDPLMFSALSQKYGSEYTLIVACDVHVSGGYMHMTYPVRIIIMISKNG